MPIFENIVLCENKIEKKKGSRVFVVEGRTVIYEEN